MIDTLLPLRLAITDFGEEIIIGTTPCRGLISSIAEGEQAGYVDDHTLVAEVLGEDFVSIPRNTKLTRADGSIWRVTNRPRIEHGSWMLELSKEMIEI